MIARAFLFLGLVATVMAVPYALHQLVVVDTAGDATIRLTGYDKVVAGNLVSGLSLLHLGLFFRSCWLP